VALNEEDEESDCLKEERGWMVSEVSYKMERGKRNENEK
jgi:hypothetical protein